VNDRDRTSVDELAGNIVTRDQRPLTVLYVTNEQDETYIPAVLAEEHGMDVRVVSTSSAALTRLQNEPQGFDCLVSETAGGERTEAEFGEVLDQFRDLAVVVYVGSNCGPDRLGEYICIGADDVVLETADTDDSTLLAHRIEQSVDLHRERARNRRFRATLDQIDHGVLVAGQDGRIEYTNPAFETLSDGWTELEGDGVGALRSDIRNGSVYREIREAVTTGGSWRGTVAVNGQDGETHQVELRVSPLGDATGETQWVVVGGASLSGPEHCEHERECERDREHELEAELADARTKYRTLIDAAPDAVLVADADTGDIVEANDAATDLLGRPRREILGMHQAELHPPENRDQYRDLFERHREAGEAIFSFLEEDDPIYVVTADGDRVPVEINAKVVEIDGKTLVHGHFRDISERRDRERKLQAILNGMPATAIVVNEAGEFEDILTGRDDVFVDAPDTLRGMDVHGTLPPETTDSVLETISETLATGKPQQLEYQLTVDDDTRWFEVRTAPLRSGAYECDCVVVLASDVTDRKRRERDLRSYKEAVEQAGHVVMITDTDGRIEYVNPAFEAVTGYPESEVLGERPAILKSGEHEEDFYRTLWETIRSGDIWQGELTNQRKDGERYHIEQTIAPITNEEDEIERYVAVNTDITDRKQHERQLEQERDRLEEFARTVAHDLRNPLTIAFGHVELAQGHQPDESVADALETAMTALERMETVIDEVLTLSEQGETIRDPEPVGLTEVVTAAWDHVGTSGATLSVDDDLCDRTVLADRSRFRNLLENLFRNAVDHGGPDVSVSVGPLTEAAGFFVEDDGPGLPPADYNRVFESGFTTSDGGTGFGLAIVRQIAEAHGWTVTAADATAESGGARFEIVTSAPTPNEAE